MNILTDEQLAEIADKGAEAAKSADIGLADIADRVAFARTVIDLALLKMAEGEGDLVRPEEMRHENSTRSCENRAAVINLAHRQAMAALRAQVQGEINELKVCEKSWTHAVWQMEADRDQWKARAEKAEANALSLSEKVIDLSRQLAEQKQPLGGYISSKASADREAFEKSYRERQGNSSFERWGDTYHDKFVRCAWDAWQAALAHKPQTWIACSERLPTREDGDTEGRVITKYLGRYPENSMLMWNAVPHSNSTHWMPIPPMPTAPTAEKVHGGESIDAIDQVPQEKVPTPPVGFHIATEEERKCLPEGSLIWWESRKLWVVSQNIGQEILNEFHYACPNTPPLVSFTAGKINPPPYGSWHRSDWTPEMLPDGWRPLLDGEPCEAGDKVLVMGGWSDGIDTGFKMSRQHLPTCTRRPLPTAPEKEKELEWVPLEACDVPPGSVFRLVGSVTQWAAPVDVYTAGAVFYNGSDHFMHKDWSYLMNAGYEISRNNGKTWEACKKIKQP